MGACEELLPLRVVNVCNTPDTQVIDNIRACLARGLSSFKPGHPPRERPLVIFASGPSGPQALKTLIASGQEFDLMALNGAYNVALDIGRVPDYFAMLDARAANVNFLTRPDPTTHFLVASQCHPDIFEALRDNSVTVFHLNTPAARETVPPPAVFFGGNAGTIGSSALALAGELGYRHLILFGYDSSLARDGSSHARYQPQNAGQGLIDVDLDGRKYWTTPSLADQVMTFFEWSNVLHQTYPGIVIDAAGEGLFYDWIANNQVTQAPTREEEASKYVDAYKDPWYRMSAHRRAMVRDILGLSFSKTLLDVGTGRGETLSEGRDMGMHVKGTETVPELLGPDVVYALLPELPFTDKAFELVTCFEVLEHLRPEDIVPALKELARCSSRWVVVSVCTEKDIVAGVNLHPSARSEEEWKQAFREAFGDIVPEFCGNASTLGVSPIFRFRIGE
jgi:hypothetical protein